MSKSPYALGGKMYRKGGMFPRPGGMSTLLFAWTCSRREIRNPKSETRNPKSETRMKRQTANPKSAPHAVVRAATVRERRCCRLPCRRRQPAKRASERFWRPLRGLTATEKQYCVPDFSHFHGLRRGQLSIARFAG
jgi:hypothetical protein